MLPWLVRASWLAVPFTAGTTLAAALDGRSSSVQAVAGALAWAGWALVLISLLVPRTWGLVAARCAAPALVLATLWAADDGFDWAIGVVHGVVMLALVLLPEVGEWFVNGAAYGYERRYLLRLPAPLLLGPAPVAAVLLAGAVCAPPLLLATGSVLGWAALAVCVPMAVVLARALHALAQRWAVLVPAGLVIKDHFVLLDPVLFRRLQIERVGPAAADTDALDLTASAPGLALEVQLGEKEPLTTVTSFGRGPGEMLRVGRFVFTPSRPAALLDDAADRRFRVAR